MPKKVVYTVITGKYDGLLSQPKAEGWDYICFTDDPNLKSDCWDVRLLPEELNNLSAAKKNRCVKILAHKFLPQYDFSLYIDGNVSILGDINVFVENFCKETDGYIFIGEHPHRNCIYKEEATVVKIKKDKQEITGKQVEEYRKEGFPENYGLTQNCIIFRYHKHKECIKLMEFWWNEVKNKSHRDQLSLFYSKWKTNTQIKCLPKVIFNSNYFKWGIAHKKAK